MDKIILYGTIAGVCFLIWIIYILTRRRVREKMQNRQFPIPNLEETY